MALCDAIADSADHRAGASTPVSLPVCDRIPAPVLLPTWLECMLNDDGDIYNALLPAPPISLNCETRRGHIQGTPWCDPGAVASIPTHAFTMRMV
jgi:hypothetical protein